MFKTQRIASLAVAALVAASGATVVRAEIEIDSVAGFDIGFGGLVQFDYNHFDDDRIDYSNDEDIRRAELTLSGESDRFSWEIGYDTAGEKYLDNNIAFSAAGTKITLGQFKQPNSLEELSSTKNNDFIAKAMATNAFAVSRRLGGSAMLGGDNWTVTASLFDGELTAGSDAGSGGAARVTFAPIMEEGRFVHLGLSAVSSDLPGDSIRLRLRPNADLADVRPVDTGTIDAADDQQTYGLEGIWASGPFKVQGEYLTSTIQREGPRDDFSGEAWYLSAMWNITGESWKYRSGVIRTPGPNQPASGMWQAGLRYDRADFNDVGIAGGDMRALTAGVNYYWRSNWKLAANWVRAESRRAGLVDEPDILELRAQFFW
jgi:phosphate-selective porin OprO/OprP